MEPLPALLTVTMEAEEKEGLTWVKGSWGRGNRLSTALLAHGCYWVLLSGGRQLQLFGEKVIHWFCVEREEKRERGGSGGESSPFVRTWNAVHNLTAWERLQRSQQIYCTWSSFRILKTSLNTAKLQFLLFKIWVRWSIFKIVKFNSVTFFPFTYRLYS